MNCLLPYILVQTILLANIPLWSPIPQNPPTSPIHYHKALPQGNSSVFGWHILERNSTPEKCQGIFKKGPYLFVGENSMVVVHFGSLLLFFFWHAECMRCVFGIVKFIEVLWSSCQCCSF
jgi:hypothetical protein